MSEEGKKPRIEWFKHDAGASRDEKLLQLRAAGGWEYVGLWWALLELLTKQDDFALKAKSLPGTAILFALPADKFQAFLDTCVTAELLKHEDDVFYSPSLRRSLSRYCEISDKRAEAGAKGAASKGEAKEKESKAIAQQLPSNCPIYSSSSSDLNSFDSLGGAGGAVAGKTERAPLVYLADTEIDCAIAEFMRVKLDPARQWVEEGIKRLSGWYQKNPDKYRNGKFAYVDLTGWAKDKCVELKTQGLKLVGAQAYANKATGKNGNAPPVAKTSPPRGFELAKEN